MGPQSTMFKILLFVILCLVIFGLIKMIPEVVQQLKTMTLTNSNEAQFCSDQPTDLFVWPMNNLEKVITSCTGSRDTSTCTTTCSATHKGIDIKGTTQHKVLAAAAGTIVSAGGSYNTIVIDHKNGLKTKYLHNSKILVSSGTVTQGQEIAIVGGQGPKGPNSYPTHLHFEVLKNDESVDPLCYFDRLALKLEYSKNANCYYNKELYSYGGEIKKNTYYA